MNTSERIVNCIGHDIVIVDDRGNTIDLPVSKTPARVKVKPVGSFAGIPVLDSFKEVENLPDPEFNTIYVVSRMVRQVLDQQLAHLHPSERRIDVMVPAEPIYAFIEGRKRVKACRALAR